MNNPNGCIWVDPVNGVAGPKVFDETGTIELDTGHEPFVNGTADNPAASWMYALSLSYKTGIKEFRVVTHA